jgi:uncharacterized membrane protein
MISGIRAIDLFILVMLIRLGTSPLDVTIPISMGFEVSISWLTPILAFFASYLVVTYKKLDKTDGEDWAIVGGMTLAGFVPVTLAIPLFMISLLILGWMMHISGRVPSD